MGRILYDPLLHTTGRPDCPFCNQMVDLFRKNAAGANILPMNMPRIIGPSPHAPYLYRSHDLNGDGVCHLDAEFFYRCWHVKCIRKMWEQCHTTQKVTEWLVVELVAEFPVLITELGL